MAQPRYLTKSRFKIGLQCPTGLYYTGKKEVYADNSVADSFLLALAEGGFQVGELAKFLFCENHVEDQVTITERGYSKSLEQTRVRLSQDGKIVVAEAAFQFENFFIRADVVVKEGNHIDLY
jgi:hypothetical protein